MTAERRKRILTDEDIDALREVLKQDHHCKFSSEEVQQVRDFVQIYKETRSVALKALIGFIFFFVMAVVILGFSHDIIPKTLK